MSKKILIVDDKLDWLLRTADLFEDHGYKVTTCSRPREALKAFSACRPDAVLLDIKMPGRDGFELLREIKQKDPRVCVVMLSAYGDADTVVKAIKLKADSFVDKSSDPRKIVITVEKELSHKATEIKLVTLQAEKGITPMTTADIVGESPGIMEVKDQIRASADDDRPVLITGENGVGKDVAACALHYESCRRNEPFNNLNCPSIPETLFESEIFGYEKGAFTGAFKRKKGLIEATGRGTMLLNEFVDIPSYVQAKLLLVLELGEYRRVGSEGKSQRSDARFLAATNKNISVCLRTGKLGDDLYFRLNQVRINVPPLRDRGEDVILLAEHFARQEAQKLGKPLVGLSRKSKEILLDYHWPGNVRQLHTLMCNVIHAGSEGPIRGYGFFADCDGDLSRPQRSGRLKDMVKHEQEELEKHEIGEALRRLGGSRKQVADALGMSYRSLLYKMKKYGLREVYG